MMIINESAYYKKYNIEWYWDNGELRTTSAILTGVNGGYFYFEYPNGGLLMIERRAIRSLECLED